jgi:hypothetical protein
MNDRMIQIALLLAEAWERRLAVVRNDPVERGTVQYCRAKADYLRELASDWKRSQL